MHIVILDGGSTNPGDVSWAPLRALGSVTVYDSTKPEEIVERAVLIRNAVGFIRLRRSAFTSPRVSSVSGQCSETTSAFLKSASSSAHC